MASPVEEDSTLLQKLSKFLTIRQAIDFAVDTDVRYFYSTAAVSFCLAVLFTLVGNQETNIGVHGVLACIIWWGLLLYLGFLEGVQAGVVALKPVDKEIYRKSHPHTYAITTLCHRGDNLDKFIVGRQFLVIFVVFVINFSTGYDNDALGSNPLGVSGTFMTGFVKTGMVSALVTIVFGQLISQIIASKCNIDFLNYRFHYYGVACVSLGMEWIGLMHFVYLVQRFAIYLSSKGNDKSEAEQPTASAAAPKEESPIVFWIKAVGSTVILTMCLAVIIEALFQGNTNLATTFEGMPNWVGFIIFLILIVCAGLLEGLQISLFALQNMDPEEYKTTHPRAAANVAVVFNGANLQGFLIGRQILISLTMFVLSLICSVQADIVNSVVPETGETTYKRIFGIAPWFSEGLLETGLLGAVVLTILGSLSARMLASAFPVGFCNTPGMNVVIYLSLLTEFIGLTHVSWPIADGLRNVLGPLMRDDEYYTQGKKASAAGNLPADGIDIELGNETVVETKSC